MSKATYIDDSSIDDETHPVRIFAEEVENAMSEFWRPVSLVEHLESPDLREGSAVNLNLSRFVDDQIQGGHFPLSLNGMFDRFHTGTKDGSSNVTAIHVLLENSITESIKWLAQTGQLDDLCEFFEEARSDGDPAAEIISAYVILTYAKGWMAERIITADDRFSKLFITNDQAGQDVRRNDDGTDVQVKPITSYASKGPAAFKSKTVPHCFYQWTHGGLYFADTDNALDANDAAAADAKKTDAGKISKTVIRTTSKRFKRADGSKYRYLWW